VACESGVDGVEKIGAQRTGEQELLYWFIRGVRRFELAVQEAVG